MFGDRLGAVISRDAPYVSLAAIGCRQWDIIERRLKMSHQGVLITLQMSCCPITFSATG